jgi:mono/diheme cytochrome c family protein
MKRYFLFLVLFFAVSTQLSAQEWIVPADEAGKLSPFAFSDSTRQAGGVLYNNNCKSCHGDPGKNNVVKLVPIPPDPASEQMQKNTDGGMNYKLASGRGLMPSFKNTLSMTDTWKIVSFMRSFNDKYVQEVAKKTDLGTAFQNVKILLSYNKETKQVKVMPTYVKDNKQQYVVGAEVKLFVKRYFGNLMIDAAKTTDSNGFAYFNFPGDLPGDSLGVVHLIAKPSDEAAFGEAKADTSLTIGVATYRPPLNEPRAMWNVVSKAPVWLLLTYSLTVLAVWGLIFYILLEIRRIYKSEV